MTYDNWKQQVPEKESGYETDYYKAYMNLLYENNEAKKQINHVMDILKDPHPTIYNLLKQIKL